MWFCSKFVLLSFSPPLHSVVQFSKQNRDRTFDIINTYTPVDLIVVLGSGTNLRIRRPICYPFDEQNLEGQVAPRQVVLGRHPRGENGSVGRNNAEEAILPPPIRLRDPMPNMAFSFVGQRKARGRGKPGAKLQNVIDARNAVHAISSIQLFLSLRSQIHARDALLVLLPVKNCNYK